MLNVISFIHVAHEIYYDHCKTSLIIIVKPVVMCVDYLKLIELPLPTTRFKGSALFRDNRLVHGAEIGLQIYANFQEKMYLKEQ
jgi:hypothetical protein